MNREKINKINVERLTRWKDDLNNNHATPIMLLGIGHDHNKGILNICVTEEMTNFQILTFLREATRQFEQQIAQQG